MHTYQLADVSPDMSLPRDARRAQRAAQRPGRGADRVRLRLPRGHLRHVRPDDQRRARTARRSPRPASCTCARSPTARRSPSSRGAPTPSRSSRTSSSTAAPSTGSSRPAATSRSTPARRPRPTRSRSPSDDADRAFNVATCIGCGACVAACPNGSASLFMGAKITHLGGCPRASPSATSRVVNMVAQHDHEGFGGCTNIGECTAACPKEIPLDVISSSTRTSAPRSSTVTERRTAAPTRAGGSPALVARRTSPFTVTDVVGVSAWWHARRAVSLGGVRGSPRLAPAAPLAGSRGATAAYDVGGAARRATATRRPKSGGGPS